MTQAAKAAPAGLTSLTIHPQTGSAIILEHGDSMVVVPNSLGLKALHIVPVHRYKSFFEFDDKKRDYHCSFRPMLEPGQEANGFRTHFNDEELDLFDSLVITELTELHYDRGDQKKPWNNLELHILFDGELYLASIKFEEQFEM